jgi:hypothetical protein
LVTLLAGSFYLICTAAFALLSFVIGLRMIGLSRRTGKNPEFLLGFGLILTAGVGYGLMITAAVMRPTAVDPSSAGLAALTMLGKMIHNVGVMCVIGFVVLVFRRGSRWAYWLAGSLSVVLWVGFVGVCLTGGLESGRQEGLWYWLEFSVIGTYPLWNCIEAFRYYVSMRKRRELGLADPLLVNRFLLWGVAAALSIAAIWSVSLPALMGMSGIGPSSPFMASCMIATSIFGTGCVVLNWVTFFPPKRYVDWIAARSTQTA